MDMDTVCSLELDVCRPSAGRTVSLPGVSAMIMLIIIGWFVFACVCVFSFCHTSFCLKSF